ncbi:hypothetical protein BV25DRAFT_1843124 [Artomyces pyxidatus]|uniref:Uncharacterized protein n=1 Tax=Artomyces pyxidatus TaxID=48021 RepID=A0ACB8SGZ7_9AGAM|nr:hypothetical protein BV25DRAFT_1843124 [Artomyces pyxidatus]
MADNPKAFKGSWGADATPQDSNAGWGADAASSWPRWGTDAEPAVTENSLSYLAVRLQDGDPLARYDDQSEPVVPVNRQGISIDVCLAAENEANWVGFGEDPAPTGAFFGQPPSGAIRIFEPQFVWHSDTWVQRQWWNRHEPWQAYRPLPSATTRGHWLFNAHRDRLIIQRVDDNLYELPETERLERNAEISAIHDIVVQMTGFVGFNECPIAIPLFQAGPQSGQDLHNQSSLARERLLEWRGCLVYMLRHLRGNWKTIPITLPHWTDHVERWELPDASLVGTLIDFALPANTWPNVRELLAHGAYPRYLWHRNIPQARLAALDPLRLRARSWLDLAAEKSKRELKAAKNARKRDKQTEIATSGRRATSLTTAHTFWSRDSLDSNQAPTNVRRQRALGDEFEDEVYLLNFPHPGHATFVLDGDLNHPLALDVLLRDTTPYQRPSTRSRPTRSRTRSPSPRRLPPALRTRNDTGGAGDAVSSGTASPGTFGDSSKTAKGKGRLQDDHQQPEPVQTMLPWEDEERLERETALARAASLRETQPRQESGGASSSRVQIDSVRHALEAGEEAGRATLAGPAITRDEARTPHFPPPPPTGSTMPATLPIARCLVERITTRSPTPPSADRSLLARLSDDRLSLLRRMDLTEDQEEESGPPGHTFIGLGNSATATQDFGLSRLISPHGAYLEPAAEALTAPVVPADVRGYIRLRPQAMLRTALWYDLHPTEPRRTLVGYFLARGIAFSWSVPMRLLPPLPNAADLPEEMAYAGVARLIQEDWTSFHESSIVSFEINARRLLERPHARFFLTRGGILWRLALHYGPHHLLTDAASGPSRLVTQWTTGAMTTVNQTQPQLAPIPVISDQSYGNEEARLIGMTGGRSVWPDASTFESSVAWNGEWSVQNEIWFQRRLERFDQNSGQSMTNPLLRTSSQWRSDLRDTLHRGQRRSVNGPGSLSHALDMIEDAPDVAALARITLEGTDEAEDWPAGGALNEYMDT